MDLHMYRYTCACVWTWAYAWWACACACIYACVCICICVCARAHHVSMCSHLCMCTYTLLYFAWLCMHEASCSSLSVDTKMSVSAALSMSLSMFLYSAFAVSFPSLWKRLCLWLRLQLCLCLCKIKMSLYLMLLSMSVFQIRRIISISFHASKGWQRPIWCLKLQVIFRKRATDYRAHLQKMTSKDKASYVSTPPCTPPAILLHHRLFHTFPLCPAWGIAHCIELLCVAVWCRVLQCVAVCCSVLHLHLFFQVYTRLVLQVLFHPTIPTRV